MKSLKEAAINQFLVSAPAICRRRATLGYLALTGTSPGQMASGFGTPVAAAAFPYRLNGSLAKFGMRHVRGELGREVNFPRGNPKSTVNLHRLFLKWLTQPVASRPWAPCSARPLDVSGWV